MAKCNIVPFLLKYTVVIVVLGSPLTSQVIAQQTSWDSLFQSFLASNDQPLVYQPGEAQVRQPQSESQEDEPPIYQPGGARGSGQSACPLAPLAQKSNSDLPSEIWNHRPIFVWKGTVEKIELYSEPEGNLIWEQTVEPKKNYLSYTGEPLKSGATYQLYFYDVAEPEPGYPATVDLQFKVVDPEKYEQITQELNKLQTEHQQKQSTPEEIALARAQYFADRQLWSDVIMESVLVENPPSSLKELLETEIPEHLCSPFSL